MIFSRVSTILALFVLAALVCPGRSLLADTFIETVGTHRTTFGPEVASLKIRTDFPLRSRTQKRSKVKVEVRQVVLGESEARIDTYRRRVRVRGAGKPARFRIHQPLYSKGPVELSVKVVARLLPDPSWSEPVLVEPTDLLDLPEEPDTDSEEDLAPGYSDPNLSPGNTQCSEQLIQLAIFWTNEVRIANGVTPLDEHLSVRYAALQKANQIAATGEFSHDGWLDFMLSVLQFGHFGNNIAHSYTDAEELVDAFSRSPNHMSNMISPNYQFIGIGCVKAADGKMYWSQNFYGL
ncbi:MAG: CAP domain-containing protein [Bdellovibrionales bacterium]|nr:CAP domain-containing protein [Bdellovibrionales bacterium]